MTHTLSLNDYLEYLQECYEKLEATTVEGVSELADYEVEERCDGAVGKHEVIGDSESPRLNASVIAHSIRTEDVLDDHSPDELYESGGEYLADLAHQATKYDLINRVFDERSEAER